MGTDHILTNHTKLLQNSGTFKTRLSDFHTLLGQLCMPNVRVMYAKCGTNVANRVLLNATTCQGL